MTALPLSLVQAGGWHLLCSTNDTGSSMLVELLHWKEIKITHWMLPQLSLPVQALQFLYSHISLKTRDCTYGKYSSFFPHLPSSTGTQTSVALTKAFLWWVLWLEQGDVPALQTCKRLLLAAVVNSMPIYLWRIPTTIPLVPFGTFYSLTIHLLACHIYVLRDIHCTLFVLFCWSHNLIATPNSVKWIQYCQVTSAKNFSVCVELHMPLFLWTKETVPSTVKGTIMWRYNKVTHSVLIAALQGEQVTAQGLSSVSFPTLLPTDLPW